MCHQHPAKKQIIHFIHCQLLPVLMLGLALCACQRHTQSISQGYIEGRFTYVSSQTSGTLNKLYVQRGTTVKKHDMLFQLNADPQTDALRQAQAQLTQTKALLANAKKGARPTELAAITAQRQQVIAKLRYAKKTVARYAKLLQQHFIEKATYDNAVSTYQNLLSQRQQIDEQLKTAKLGQRSDQINAAAAKVKAAQAAVQQAKWVLAQKAITAPVNGLVFDTYYRPGETVPTGQPVLSMLSPSNIRIIFFVPETQLANIHLQDQATITFDNQPQPFTAKITYISPKAEYTPPIIYSEKTRSTLVYRIEATPLHPNLQTMHPGQPVTVQYALSHASQKSRT